MPFGHSFRMGGTYALAPGVGAGGELAIEPSNFSGLIFWVRGDLGVTLDTGKVSAWADQSTQGNDVTQTEADHRPLVGTAELNGHDVILFNSEGQTYAFARRLFTPDSSFTPNPNTQTAFHGFAVSRQPANPTNGGYIWYSSTQLAHTVATDLLVAVVTNSSTTTEFASPIVVNTWYIHELQVDLSLGSNEVQYYRNGTLDIQTSNSGTLLSDSQQTLNLGYPNNAPNFFDVDIAEVIMYNEILSAEDRTSILNYLTDRYAL